MGHLNTETLARLVDEPAGPDETEHLATCDRCAEELDALRRQREALAELPDAELPPGEWDALHDRLVREGLVDPPTTGTASRFRDWGPGATRWLPGSAWMQAAAAAVLFLGGAAAGAAAANAAGPGSAAGEATPVSEVASVDQAAGVLQDAEDRYVSALLRYRELAGEDAATDGGDAASRYAALEALLAASQAAVRRAPADPFINGVLVSTLAERQATLQQISTSDADNWF